MSTIIKGSSVPISELTISDSSGIIDITTLDQVIVYAVSKYKKVIAKMAYPAKSGYITMTLTDSTKLSFTIPGSMTKMADNGDIRIQVYQEDADITVPIDQKTKLMGSSYLVDTDGSNVEFVDEPINAEA